MTPWLPADWERRTPADSPRHTATPPHAQLPEQGWKIHLSAATAHARELITIAAGICVRHCCAFTFAATPRDAQSLNSRNHDRSGSGKLVTLYPQDEEHFLLLAAELHDATARLPGPTILSDRAYCPGSRVHYRYGSFASRCRLTQDGQYQAILITPDGAETPEVSGARYWQPSWVTDPVPRLPRAEAGTSSTPHAGTAQPSAASGRTAPRDAPSGVLLGDGRYAVTSALRHGAKGGVFLGSDTHTGEAVVVKQGRPHIEVDRAGRDARAALRHEAALLEQLHDTGLTPRLLSVIDGGADQLLLVQEKKAGVPLGEWVTARLPRDGSPDVSWAEALPLVRRLHDALSRVHDRGLVLRDLTPSNVLVAEDHSVCLLDLELAALSGSLVGCAGSPGYQAPEEKTPEPDGPSSVRRTTLLATQSSDLFALGGLLFLLATGQEPTLPADHSPAREDAERLRCWLLLAARHGETARRLAPVILGLRAHDPRHRWSLRQVSDTLDAADPDAPDIPDAPDAPDEDSKAEDGPVPAAAVPAPPAVPPGPGAPPSPEALLTGGLRHLVASCTPERADRLWPTVPDGALSDPCAVQHGGAGVLATLVRAARQDLPQGVDAERLTHTIRSSAAWIAHRALAEPTALPGLHFGRAGTAWALLDAAELLDDASLAARARQLAARVPVRWSHPGICHGAAGAGMLRLRLTASPPTVAAHSGDAQLADGDRPTDTTLLDAVRDCADGLLLASASSACGLTWPIPADFPTELAGTSHLGYAHGVAGVAAYLLDASQGTDEPRYLAAAREGAETLLATERLSSDPAGPAGWWPQSADEPPQVRLAHWCDGASGVGSFLVRLYQATGEEQWLAAALRAGEAVVRSRWHGGPSVCHGLAGDGEFLLDLAAATGQSRWREGAHQLAAVLAARSALRHGHPVPPDETGRDCAADYGTGVAGVLAFLLRLTRGGPRMWTDPRGEVPAPAARFSA